MMIKILNIAILIFIIEIGMFQSNNDKGFHEKFVLPSFPGGIDSLESYLKKNLSYPETAVIDSIEGTVIIHFFVTPDGYVEEVTVKQSVRYDLDSEAIRIISKMPKWNEGTIRTPFNLPINFKLRSKPK